MCLLASAAVWQILSFFPCFPDIDNLGYWPGILENTPQSGFKMKLPSCCILSGVGDGHRTAWVGCCHLVKWCLPGLSMPLPHVSTQALSLEKWLTKSSSLSGGSDGQRPGRIGIMPHLLCGRGSTSIHITWNSLLGDLVFWIASRLTCLHPDSPFSWVWQPRGCRHFFSSAPVPPVQGLKSECQLHHRVFIIHCRDCQGAVRSLWLATLPFTSSGGLFLEVAGG